MMEMMLIALSLSVDALGIGLSYGIRQMKVTGSAKLIVFLIAAAVMGISISLGDMLSAVLGREFGKYGGTAILIALGIWVILQAFSPEKEDSLKPAKQEKEKAFNIIIKSLGITIRIIKQPQSIDMDSNSLIERKEALYLGLAMSIDGAGAGLAIGAMGAGRLYLPLLSGIFQVLFLTAGLKAGEKFSGLNGNRKLWNILSGAVLITIALLRII